MSAMTISPAAQNFSCAPRGGLIFEILFVQIWVPRTNPLSDPAQGMLVLKVNEQAIEEKYEWSSPQTLSSSKN